MNVYVEWEIELGPTIVEFVATFWYRPGEPMVRYYPDGSGYPGSPPDCEYCSVEVHRIVGETYEYNREEKSDWFLLLDQLVDDMINTDETLLEILSEEVLEYMGEF